jgi:hypothetical protein
MEKGQAQPVPFFFFQPSIVRRRGHLFLYLPHTDTEEIMLSLIKRSCLMLLALPLTALADAVIVTTHAAGTVSSPNGIVLNALGLADTGVSELPYELTIQSSFDPVTALPGRDEWAFDYSSDIVVDFRIGGESYHYAGLEASNAVLYTPFVTNGDGYQHEVYFTPLNSSYSVRFSQYALWPAGGLGAGGALTPRDIGGSADGYLDIGAYPLNPDAPGSWRLGGTASSFSVQVMSAVPEPAPLAMLLAGLGGVALLRRIRQLHCIKQGGTSSSKASTR